MEESSTYTMSAIDDTQEKDTNWFTRNAQIISSNVQKITERTATIRRLLLHLQTSQNDDHSFQKVHEIQHNTTELARSTSKRIKRLQGPMQGKKTSSSVASMIDEEILNPVKLAEDVSEAIKNLQSVQHLTSQMHQEVNSNYENRRISKTERLPIDKHVQLTIIKQKSFDRDEKNIRILQDRKRAFEELEQDMSDLTHIYQDLYSMSQEQRNVVGQFEDSVGNSEIDIHQGSGMLSEAQTNKKQSRKKKLFLISIFILIFVVFVGIIALMVIFVN